MKKALFGKFIIVLPLIAFVMLFIVLVNNLVNFERFAIDEGIYEYEDLFCIVDSSKNYYRFGRSFFDQNDKIHIPLDDCLENAQFKAENRIKASIILSLYHKKNIFGYCLPIKGRITDFPLNFSDEELTEFIERKGYIVSGEFFDFFGKSYLFAVIKSDEYIYDKDKTLIENYLSSVSLENNHKIALFEIGNHNINLMKPTDVQSIIYEKSFS